jgi:hypothetical protein
MRVLLLIILSLSQLVFANDEISSLKNDREGKSYYSGYVANFKIKHLLKKKTRRELLSIYQTALHNQNQNSFCAYTLNRDLISSGVDLKAFIYFLREENEIDDVTAQILLKANKVKTTVIYEKDEVFLDHLDNSDKNQAILKLIMSFDSKFAQRFCFDEAYRNLKREILKINPKFSPSEFESLLYYGLNANYLSEDLYTKLEQARANEIDLTVLDLSSYQKKIKSLRTQYPLKDSFEKSDFVSQKVKKLHLSRRQKLFENYTDLQIILMGNVIKKLRERLEYDAVQILGFKDGVLQETLPLEPMERFRFAIKVLRKEMSLLAINSFFNGRSPDYIDLMTASYELGIIPASELEAVAGLEEIWNPKKTFWDKAGVWVRTFSTVATIAIPAPYGFLPALAIVAIEATVGKKKDTTKSDPTSIF